MDNLTASKSHLPCQSWAGQNGWSTASTQGALLNPLPSSQHLSLGSSSDQRPSYDHMQESNQSCLNDLSALSSRNNTHHSALYKASHMSSNQVSTTLFGDTAIPSASHIISFAQQSPHTSSLLLTSNQGKNIPPPSLPQTNPAPQPCRPQHVPLVSPNNPYKASFQPPLTNQGLPNGLQDLPISLPSCGQREQRQWMPSSHCRGAVSKSVPDAAAHPNKEPEGNISSLASREGQRLLLLQHRAQLLKQVAELDKILETLHPGDSSNGQSQHTAVQSHPSMADSAQCEQTKTSDAQRGQLSAGKSKSHLSANCSSSASYDEHSEDCDRPEDPMSATESLKKENASAESEYDSDPDYLPYSDREFSDFLSDHDGGSSDESSHSRTSTPTDKRPSVPEKKRAKLGSSLLKDKSGIPPKQIRTTKPKKRSSEAVVLPSSNSKGRRVYDRRNYCLFCAKPVCKMARHLERIHSDKTEVAAAFQYPQSSRERQKIWNRLINQGNFAHNKDVMESGKGQLVARKRPRKSHKAEDFLHCLYCRGLFVRKALSRHMKSCPEKVENEDESEIRRSRIASQCVLETLGDLGISEGFKSVLSQMIYDDATRAVMEDGVILQYGEFMFDQYGSDPKKHEYIRQNIRQIARLVLEAQKITPLEKLEDFFLPSNFPHVVSAVNVLAGYNAENKTYSVPSLAIKLGYHLQKTCSIVEGNAVKCNNASLAESARNFLSVYQQNWNKLISGGALTSLREAKLNKEKKVPFAQDVKRLNFHMENVHLLADEKLRDSPSAENYAALAKVVLVRTILFNRRSALEVASMPLTAFMSRKKSNLHDGMDVSVSDLEKTMCGFFTRVDIRGKCGRTVPVLLKPSFVSALELLVNVRDTCGVPSKNPYLFGRPHALSFYRWSECIQTYVKACGAKNPEALKSSKIPKHYATMLQLMNLDDNEADQILGPNNQVRNLRQDSSTQLNDVEMESDERGQQAATWDLNEDSGARFGLADILHEQAHGATRSVKSDNKGFQNQGKHKWEEAEVCAVERHLMRLIQEHKLPQKNDCVQCLEAEPEALKTRTWKGVKDYVRNRITALKRQSRTSQATSSNRNWSGQVEPQQSTGHFQQL
ncbi:uncharacterized protein LOC117252805 isoform X2 [Epinephelus lanceolatus]|uniref:uncharacterized protein LOC117252805 isoform X2 n=1 Tax=Epinephelus lanceolatus TaxID=310571 RepID=UPI001444AE72|nr:uncharacterized protein LOC117252805 isoform X2 [Epinephelus lanceolatus]